MKRIAFLILLLVLGSPAQGTDSRLPEPAQDSDFRQSPANVIKLGQLLFYDRVLSGTYRVSCATCHNPDRASSNGFRTDNKPEQEGDTLAINGLPIYDALKPSAKHAPALFNLGAKEFTVMFGDGRVAELGDGEFLTPAGDELPEGLRDVLAAQALFPAITGDELVGTVDNDVKAVAHLGNRAVWKALTGRVQYLEEYWPPVKAAYPELKSLDDLNITYIANAISAFVASEWRSDESPFDAFLRGDAHALSQPQLRGLDLFYGKAGCSACHSGTYQTDHDFHAVATPLWRFDIDLFGEEFDLHLDRAELTGKEEDRYRRRTPSLRNVEFTAPYGHAGSFETLEEFLSAHLNPVEGIDKFVDDRRQGKPLPKPLQAAVDGLKQRNQLAAVSLSEPEFQDLLAFLNSLSQPDILQGKLGRPDIVPSSLALD